MSESRTIAPPWEPTFTVNIEDAYPDYADEPWYVDAPNPKLWEGLPAYRAEVTQDPEELPDDQIVPDNTEPLPPEPEVKTDPVDDE